MSNPVALTSSGGGGGVQLQADITGLTQFLMNLGLAGLKHHALAGVDTHTILSMLAIAEICPASMQCRMHISQRRNEQRRQSMWFYKVVEVGAGTNFIVDQLLQTRAGENIMAMISGLAPLLLKNAFSTAILYIFQKQNTPPGNIPGLAQLEKFRETVLPLASAMDIKDKVFQYHKWIMQLLESDSNTSFQTRNNTKESGAYTAMPSAETIADIICYLSKLTKEQDEVFVLVYHGLLGAAWVAAYAQDILGLPVCMFVNEHLAVPLSGDHNTARVILKLYSKKQTCELRRVGKVEDFIKIQSMAAREESGWLIDIRAARYYLPERSTSKGSLDHVYVTLARSLTLSYVRILARSLNRQEYDTHWSGMKRYAVARLPLLKEKALANMRLLGFDCTSELAQTSDWKLSFRLKIVNNQRLLAPHKSWKDTFDSTLLVPYAKDEYDFNTDGQKAINFLFKAVNFAATMAFTNWGRVFCGMSVRYLESDWRESWFSAESRPLPYRDPRGLLWHDPILELFMDKPPTRIETTEILQYAIYISTDVVDFPEIQRFLNPANNVIATSCEGLIVARTMAMSDVGAFRQISLLSFYPGAIMCEGESLTSIRSEDSGLETSAELVLDGERVFSFNAVKDLQVVTRSLIERQEASVETQILLGNECCQLVDAITISETIPELLVPDGCSHDYKKSYLFPQRLKTVDEKGEEIYHAAPVWQGGLSFQSYRRPESRRVLPASTKVYVQNVDKNPLGQWIACQWTSDWHSAVILQENSCLECIAAKLQDQRFQEVCIINGQTEQTSAPHSPIQLRVPNHERGRSSSIPLRQPSANEQGSHGVQRCPSTGATQHGQRNSANHATKPQSPSTFDAMGVPAPETPQRSNWKKFGWQKQKSPT